MSVANKVWTRVGAGFVSSIIVILLDILIQSIGRQFVGWRIDVQFEAILAALFLLSAIAFAGKARRPQRGIVIALILFLSAPVAQIVLLKTLGRTPTGVGWIATLAWIGGLGLLATNVAALLVVNHGRRS